MTFHGPSGRCGQSMVEFTMMLPLFLSLCFVTADTTRFCHDWAVLQFAVDEAARYGALGKKESADPNRDASIRKRAQKTASKLGVEDVTVKFFDRDGHETAGAAGASSFMRVRAETILHLNPVSGIFLSWTGNYGGACEIHAEALVRNEAFA